MATPAANPSPLRPRLGRLTWRLAWTALVVWIVWLAVMRWNGVPADPRGAYAERLSAPPIEPDRDQTEELLSLLAALPPPGQVSLNQPPEGWLWHSGTPGLLMAWALTWTPLAECSLIRVPRAFYADCVITRPETAEILARLALIKSGGYRTTTDVRPALHGAVLLFLDRAGIHDVWRDDVDSALADIEAAYRLIGLSYESGSLGDLEGAVEDERIVNAELRRLAAERPLSNRQSARILQYIQETLSERAEFWKEIARIKAMELHGALDLAYTKGGTGDGWLMLSRLDSTNRRFVPCSIGMPRSGVWNIFSPAFNDRRTVVTKIEVHRRLVEDVGRLPDHEADQCFRLATGGYPFNVLDGPLQILAETGFRRYGTMLREFADRRATCVTVALSAYRRDHGHYPPALEHLLGTYLEILPLDPYIDQPLRYRLLADHDYCLYSVGPDRVDDAGRKWPTRTDEPGAQRYDVVFEHGRAGDAPHNSTLLKDWKRRRANSRP